MRVVFTSYPLHGHINPMLPLALAMQRAGNEVVFATGPDRVGYVRGFGLTTWPIGPTHAQAESLGKGPLRFFMTTGPLRADDLLPRLAAFRPDLLVADEFDIGGPVAARVSDVPFVLHGLGLMIPRSIWEPLEQAAADLHARWRFPDGAATVRRALYLEATPPSLRAEGERTWVRTQPLRPTPGLPTVGEALPEGFDALPHARTAHLTLGTLFHDRVDVLTAAIEGLRSLELNVVVTLGPGVDPARFGPQPPNVLIGPYIPHLLLLPRCHLVVSQGGAGIMLGALLHGLPQLLLPQGADQFLNASVCTARGAALALPPGELSAVAVRDASRALVADGSYAASARAIGDELRAMPDPDQVAASLAKNAEP